MTATIDETVKKFKEMLRAGQYCYSDWSERDTERLMAKAVYLFRASLESKERHIAELETALKARQCHKCNLYHIDGHWRAGE